MVSVPTSAIAEAVRAARESDGRTPLRIVGAGSWLDAGRPVLAERTIDVGTGSEIVEYEPGDLTLTARASTPLAALRAITRAESQWMPLDPHGSPEGTLGATIATASCGPLACAYGGPRDHLLGCEFVTGTGDVVRAGGRVVKNVAGFDLVRLITGSWGTLGVVTEATVRLRALPEVDVTLAVRTDADAGRQWLRQTEFRPLAAELVTPTLARTLAVGDETTLLVRLGGNDPLVRAATASLSALGDVYAVHDSTWLALSACEPLPSAVVRLSTAPSRVAALWERTAVVLERVGAFAHATLSRGIVRCIIPLGTGGGGDEENARLRGIIGALRLETTCVAERLPAAIWTSLMSSPIADALSTQVRGAFDPDRLLNPGILGELA